MKRFSVQLSLRNWVGILSLAALVLLIGWLEQAQPGGLTIATLTGGVILFDTLVRIGLLTIVVVGLNLLMGYAGQVSLGQAAFYGIGAYVSGIFTARAAVLNLPVWLAQAWWWPWLLMLGGMLLAGGFAALVGRPILSLKGHYLAMATLGLGVMIYILFRENFGISTSQLSLTGGADGISDVPRLRIGSYPLWPVERYYYLVWLMAIICIVVALNIVNSRVGRALRALHSSDIAAEAIGIDTARYKQRALVISVMFASLAGSLYAHFQSAVAPSTFNFVASLELVVMAAVGGLSSIWGAPFGVAIIFTVQEFIRSRLSTLLEGTGSEYEVIGFGLILVVLMIFAPDGIILGVERWLRRRSAAPETSSAMLAAPVSAADGNGQAGQATAAARAPTSAPVTPGPNGRASSAEPLARGDASPPPSSAPPLLEMSKLTKSFGGLMAVDHVSGIVRRGEIKGIIGPNGAGKTTVFNLISGVYQPTSGDICFDGQSIVGLKPHQIATRGLARTFQNVRLFDTMTVLENVMIGRHIRTHAGFLAAAAHTRRARAEEATTAQHALRLLEFVGLAARAHDPATNLPLGLQRKLEIARALATEPKLLLLDEPAAGLNSTERQALIELIGHIRATGTTVVLVEHDMNLVMEIVDELIVLVYGRAIADGPPIDIQRHPEVVTAYLGEYVA